MSEISPDAQRVRSTIPGKRATIFLIEDEVVILDLLKSVLELEGYDVLVASNGEKALDLYIPYQNKIDLIVSDLELPGMKGDEMYLEMKKITPKIKFIFASGYIDDYMRTYLQALGVKDFVDKPYHPFQILQTIRVLLGEEIENVK